MLTYIMDEKRKEQMAVATRKYAGTDKGRESQRKANLNNYHKNNLNAKRVPFQTAFYGSEGEEILAYVNEHFGNKAEFVRRARMSHERGEWK